LKRVNRIFSDNLLHARKNIVIPRKEEEGHRAVDQKQLSRQFQHTTGCIDGYIVRKYLVDSEWNVERAVGVYAEDADMKRRCPNQWIANTLLSQRW